MLPQQYLNNFFTAVNYRWKATGADVGKGVFFPADGRGWPRLEGRILFCLFSHSFARLSPPVLVKRQKTKKKRSKYCPLVLQLFFTPGCPDVGTTTVAGGDT